MAKPSKKKAEEKRISLIEKQISEKRRVLKHAKIGGIIGVFFFLDVFSNPFNITTITGGLIVLVCIFIHYDLGKKIKELEAKKGD